MNLVQEKVIAVNVFPITCTRGNFPVAASQRMLKPPMTDPLSILSGLSVLGNFKVEEPDIHKLFLSVAEHAGKDVRAEKEVFSALVKSTLKYRDHLHKSKGIVVTVEDVRVALNWLLPALAMAKLPESNNRVRLDLLKIWLDEIKPLMTPNTLNS